MLDATVLKSISFDTTVSEWAAIRTAARWEKKVVENLSSAGISVFLPTLTRSVRYKSRTNNLEIPLFAGYVFFDHSRLTDLPRRPDQTRYIAQIIRTADPQTLRAELSSIAEFLSNNQLVQERVFGAVGEVVRIKNGSFKDYHGTIIRQIPNKNRLVLSVSYLGLALEVVIDDCAVQRIS
jgi:transcription antitermination factor NusG